MKNFKRYAVILFASMVMMGCGDPCENMDRLIEGNQKDSAAWKSTLDGLIEKKREFENTSDTNFYNRQIKDVEFRLEIAEDNIKGFREAKRKWSCK